MRPLIGILLDYQDSGTFSPRAHHALRCAYFEAVNVAGGLPVGLGYMPETIGETLDRIDGLIVPGGFYPFPATHYGEPGDGMPPHPRAAFEIGLTARAVDRDMPVLGICAGMQILGILRGGILHRDVHQAITTTIDHLGAAPAEEIAHRVTVTSGTRLRAMTGCPEMGVNTAHREGFTTLPPTITVSATAPDGVIEALEFDDRRFVLGVQWHPEFFPVPDDPNRRIMEAFVNAAHGAGRPAPGKV